MGLEGLSDAELWEHAAAHDGQAFAELFDRHVKAVYTHCFRRTADWSMAEDLTSVVFLEAPDSGRLSESGASLPERNLAGRPLRLDITSSSGTPGGDYG